MIAAPEAFAALLPDCVAEILETMFFCDVQPAAADDPDAAGMAADSPCVVVDFEGTPSGRFWMWITSPAASTLTADFLGLEPDEVDRDKSGQTICELANMICGSVVSRLESDTAFRLSAPRLTDPADEEAPEQRQHFVMDCGRLEVACRLAG